MEIQSATAEHTLPTNAIVNPPHNLTIDVDTDDNSAIRDDTSHEDDFFSPTELDADGNNDDQSPTLFDSNNSSSVSAKTVANSGRKPANFIEAVDPSLKETNPTYSVFWTIYRYTSRKA